MSAQWVCAPRMPWPARPTRQVRIVAVRRMTRSVDLRTYAPVPAATGTACGSGSTAFNAVVDCQLTDGTIGCRNVR